MKKLLLLMGAGIGFVLGSRAGRKPYEQVEREVRKFLERPEVHDRIGAAKGAASQQFSGLTSKLPTSGRGNGSGNNGTPASGQGTDADDATLGTE